MLCSCFCVVVFWNFWLFAPLIAITPVQKGNSSVVHDNYDGVRSKRVCPCAVLFT